HHFAGKAALMAAAVEHLTTKRMAALAESLEDLPPGTDPLSAGIDLLWAGYSGTLATASTELWVAARTDPDLRAAIGPVDRALGREALNRVVALAGDLPEEQVET